jgi:hypothetical protein
MAKELSTTESMALDALRERMRALEERVEALGRHL